MFKNKKINISILLLFLSLFLISSVSATNQTDLAINSQNDEIQDYNIENSNNDLNIENVENENIETKNADTGNFSELQSLIDNSINNLTLNKNYQIAIGEGQFTEGIKVNKSNFVINGNNFTINATVPNLQTSIPARVFLITGDNVILKNIVLTGGQSKNGAAVNNTGNGLKIIDCEIVYNSASNAGGAIYNSGNNVQITGNTKIAHNKVGLWGGAIYNVGENFLITGTNNISHNIASYHGGAIYNIGGNFAINGTNYIRNNSVKGEGGAINNYGNNFLITGSNYIIYNSAKIGGAIFNDEGINFTITGKNNLNNNIATENGGAIYNHGASIKIEGYNILNNNIAGDKGGVLYNSGNDLLLTGNNTLNYNSAKDGGAIYNNKGNYLNFTIFGSNNINNNIATSGTGGIYNEVENFLISGSNNISYNSGYETGAIRNLALNFNIIGNNKINHNTATAIGTSSGSEYNQYPGAIYNLGSNFMIYGRNEINYNTGVYGGAIFNYIVQNFTISGNNTIKNNNAKKSGGGIYNLAGNNHNIIGNNIISNNIAGTNGGGIMFDSWTSTPTENILISGKNEISENSANENGGGIYNNGNNFTIIGNNYINQNNAIKEGGGIYNVGNYFTINGTNYMILNTASYGGAIYNYGYKFTIFENNFINSNIANLGGAIYNQGLDFSIIENQFMNNDANDWGKVIYNGGNLKLINSTIMGSNKTISNYGNLYLEKNLIISNNEEKIYNMGMITSLIYLTINNNITINKNYKDNFTLEMVITDDTNRNIIVSDYYSIFNTTIHSGHNMTYDIENLATFIINNHVDGIYSKDYILDAMGTFLLNGSYTGGSNVVVRTSLLNVSKGNVNLDINISVSDDGNTTIIVTTDPDVTGNITITIGNDSYEVPINNGTANITIPDLPAGNHTVEITYPGDDNFNPSNGTDNFTMPKLNPILDINTNVTDDRNLTIEINTNPRATGNVTITIGNDTYEVPINNGTAEITIPKHPAGNYTIDVTYPGDNNFNPAKNNSDVEIPKSTPTFIIDTDITPDGNLTINITTDPDVTGNITITIDNETYEVPIINGTGTITIPNMTEGNHTIDINYPGDDNYNPISNSTNIEVGSRRDVLIADNIVIYYKQGSYIIYLKDYLGNPLINKTVNITVNDVPYQRITDSSGKISMSINLNPGNYTATCSYYSDGNYTLNKNSTITVLPTIEGNDVEKYFLNDTQFYAKFLDGNGTGIPSLEVEFNINGVFYKRTTGSDGVARLNINLNPGEYILTAEHPHDGLKMSYNITVLKNIFAENITKYYKNGTQYYIEVLDHEGKPLVNTEVEVNIHGVFYKRTSNASGIVTLTINLNPGDYIATAIHPLNGLMVSNRVLVYSILYANDTTMDRNNRTSYDIKLVDGQGNPVVNETITVNIHGVFYERQTDENGIVQLNINLDPGSYIATAYYSDYALSSRIVVY